MIFQLIKIHYKIIKNHVNLLNILQKVNIHFLVNIHQQDGLMKSKAFRKIIVLINYIIVEKM